MMHILVGPQTAAASVETPMTEVAQELTGARIQTQAQQTRTEAKQAGDLEDLAK